MSAIGPAINQAPCKGAVIASERNDAFSSDAFLMWILRLRSAARSYSWPHIKWTRRKSKRNEVEMFLKCAESHLQILNEILAIFHAHVKTDD